MNKLTTFISWGVDRLNLRPLLAASRCLPSLRLAWRNREPQVHKAYVLAARAAVVLVGLVFATNGVLLLSAGIVGGSLSLIVFGVLAVPPSVLLGWSGFTPPRGGSCSAPVAFVAEIMSRVIGNEPVE